MKVDLLVKRKRFIFMHLDVAVLLEARIFILQCYSPGFGLACHLGVMADLPTIGIGKNVSSGCIWLYASVD